MKVARLGASGRAGSEITKELARRGHAVLAIDQNPDAVPLAAEVTPVRGDAFDPAALSKLIQGSDAVISALRFDVPAATLLSAAKQAGVTRFLFTGGAGSLEVAPGYGLSMPPAFLKKPDPSCRAASPSLRTFLRRKISTGSSSRRPLISLPGRALGTTA